MENKYLPIGTILELKDLEFKVIIAGFLAVDTSDDLKKIDDYIGFPYPEGYNGANSMLLFNNNDIEKVIYNGCILADEDERQETLNKIRSDIEGGKNGI